MAEHDLVGELDAFLQHHEPELIEFRRDLHAHPEVGYCEHRTTGKIARRLEAAGIQPQVLPRGTGLIADIGGGADDEATVALRADIDALPVLDEKKVPYRSVNVGACHACGHDVHTSVLLGTGLFLARAAAAGALPGKVRLIFQPAEETAGGALDVLAAGGISSVDRIFALHCDPRLDVGKIGTRIGPITAACDAIKVQLTGRGGHTARPHLTADLVYALGKIITELPAALSRLIDPRSSLSLVWGRVSAGSVANAIPDAGVLEGTLRCLDDATWHAAPEILKNIMESVASAYGVAADLSYMRAVPPAVNEAISTAMVAAAGDRVLGPDAVVQAPQSLGGEDFAWYLQSIPGSLFRLGTRRPGAVDDVDIHQPMFDVDERCIAAGVQVMATTAMTAIGPEGGTSPVAGSVEEPMTTAAGGKAGAVPLTGPLLARAGLVPASVRGEWASGHIVGAKGEPLIVPEPSKQASWASHLPTTTGRRTADGGRVYRMVGPQVTWWAWVVVVVLSAGDLAIQGHDLSALRFTFGLLTVTGLVFACTIWPRVVASQDDMAVHNPFRSFVIPWVAVKEVMVANSVQVRCARRPPKKDKTVYSWALSSPRRASARAEMRARQWERGGRNRPAGWDRMPESAKELAKLTPADMIARELASIARQVKAESVGAAEMDGAVHAAGVDGVTSSAGADGAANPNGALVHVVSGRWAWQPIAAILAPGVVFVIITMLTK